MVGTKYPYMISTSYCQNWTPVMAAREFFANALDTGDDLQHEWFNGFGKIQNFGTGFKVENLLLGESGNRDNAQAIGQFGEGLKIGALVLARNNRKVSVFSGTRQFTFTVEAMSGFDIQTLMVEVSDVDLKVQGTMVEWQCSESEFETARDMFYELQHFTKRAEVLHDGPEGKIIDESGSVYICGVKVQSGLDLLFGYDIDSKELLNRDRTILDIHKVKARICTMIERCDSEAVVELLIRNQLKRGDTIKFDELNLNVWPNSSARPVWEEILARLYGDKVCLSSGNTSADARAEYLGYKVLDMGQYTSGMTNCLRLQKADEIKLEKIQKFVTDLNTAEKRTFNRAVKAYKLYSGCDVPDEFLVSEELDEKVGGKIQTDNNIVKLIINRNQLPLGPATIYMILCHEGSHLSSHSGDCSADFEASQDDVIRHMAAAIIFKGGK